MGNRKLLVRVWVAIHYRVRLFLRKLQELHDRLVYHWLLHFGSQPLIFNEKSALIVSPHQDDEVLGCGGLIALKKEKNIPVQVVFVTNGQSSHQAHPVITPEQLVQIRKQEALSALPILGVDASDIHFLDRRDGKLRWLKEEERQQTIVQLVTILKSFKPEEIYVTHRQDGSSDHEMTYQLVKEAIAQSGIQTELFQYSIWLIWQSPLFVQLKLEYLAEAYRLDIHPVQEKKKEAIAAYRSQCLPLEPLTDVILKPAFLKRFFLPYEIFFKTDTMS